MVNEMLTRVMKSIEGEANREVIIL
jgi:hypothetical protein